MCLRKHRHHFSNAPSSCKHHCHRPASISANAHCVTHAPTTHTRAPRPDKWRAEHTRKESCKRVQRKQTDRENGNVSRPCMSSAHTPDIRQTPETSSYQSATDSCYSCSDIPETMHTRVHVSNQHHQLQPQLLWQVHEVVATARARGMHVWKQHPTGMTAVPVTQQEGAPAGGGDVPHRIC